MTVISQSHSIRRLRDCSGIAALERRALLEPQLRCAAGLADPEVDALSRRLFGLGYEDLLEPDPYDEEAEPELMMLSFPQGEVETFLTWGWDVTDEAGRPLLVLPMFSIQLFLGLAGKAQLPDVSISPDDWGAELEAEARRSVEVGSHHPYVTFTEAARRPNGVDSSSEQLRDLRPF